MAATFPSTSRKASVESYYIKELKMDIPPHRKTVLPIKGPVIHDASEFMAAHLELNYVKVSYQFQYFTGAHITSALEYPCYRYTHCMAMHLGKSACNMCACNICACNASHNMSAGKG